MILLISSFALLVGVASILALVSSVKHAPVAYEDDTGFHLAVQRSAQPFGRPWRPAPGKAPRSLAHVLVER